MMRIVVIERIVRIVCIERIVRHGFRGNKKPLERPAVSRLPEEDLLLLVSHHSELLLPLMCSNLMLLSLSSTRHCRTPYCPRKQGRFVITAYIIMSLREKGQVQKPRNVKKSCWQRDLCAFSSLTCFIVDDKLLKPLYPSLMDRK